MRWTNWVSIKDFFSKCDQIHSCCAVLTSFDSWWNSKTGRSQALDELFCCVLCMFWNVSLSCLVCRSYKWWRYSADMFSEILVSGGEFAIGIFSLEALLWNYYPMKSQWFQRCPVILPCPHGVIMSVACQATCGFWMIADSVVQSKTATNTTVQQVRSTITVPH